MGRKKSESPFNDLQSFDAKIKQNESLMEALDYGIIDSEKFSEMIRMKKIEQMLAHHNHPITLLSNGRYQTYYDNPKTKKMVEIKLSTYEKVVNRLYSLYYEQADDYTLNDAYAKWIKYKETITESTNTITRHNQHYNKYFKNTDFFKKGITAVKEIDLNSFCNELVKTYNMSRKEWINVKGILNGIFEYALDTGILKNNPMKRVKITVKYRQVNKKSSQSQCFDYEEIQKLKDYLLDKFFEEADLSFMAVLINFSLGLRVGELVSLKWKDLDFETHRVHVEREEIRNQKTGEYEVVNHTKGYDDRFVILIPDTENAFRMIRSRYPGANEENFIFIRDGNRLNARQIAYVLEKYSKTTGSPMKSTHKIRKTYASLLNANGVPIEEIRIQLGHKDLSTTMGYIYNPLTERKTYQNIVDALSVTGNS